MLAIELPEIAPKVLWEFWGFGFTETMLSGLVTVVVLIVIAIIIRVFAIPKWKSDYSKCSGLQLIVCGLVEGVDDNLEPSVYVHTHGRNQFLSFWYFAVVCFIFFGTMIEVFSLRPPTSSLSMTIAFALFTFLFIHVLGIKEAKKHNRLKQRLLRYANPINIITDAVVPISMSLRLFISVLSGFIIMDLVYLIPFPIAYPAIGNIMFTLFHAVIQSYVFFILSASFISEAIE
ncbi:MAG: F0F1 ATP synthase subunit A [Firmicutes bacterium]|nr:F0F1 ATP synthase subunit A [Bacillota bacterium]MCL1954101.1 F0F1 ATP synthase subunit A [Bacillota bacterium]